MTHLVDLNALVLADDSGAGARRVEEDPVEPADDLGELAPVDVGDDDVLAAEAGNVAAEALDAAARRVIRPDLARVAHERAHVRRLATRGGRHVEYALVRLGGERDDGQEGRRGLEDVVACEVLGSGAWEFGSVSSTGC